MNKTLKLQLSFLFGTVLLLIISISWLDLIAQIRSKYNLIKDPLKSQLFYTIIVTLFAIFFIYLFNPFKEDINSPSGLERARVDERVIRDIHVPALNI